MMSPKVLIVDDEEILRRSIKRALKREGLDLYFAENGKEGLEQFHKITPDIVILDLKMPVMTGNQFLAELKPQADDPYRVIILTGHGDDDDLKECYNLGVQAFLRKPFNPLELRGVIRQNLQLLQYRNTLEESNRILDERVKKRTAELENINHSFQRFVPKQFLNRIESSNLGVFESGYYHEELLTILFSDIRSYTQLSEQMTALENFKFLNEYFNLMEPPIAKEKGFVDKFLGDGIMALFDEDDSANQSVQAAIEMHQIIQKYNEKQEESGGRSVRFGVGIHTGVAMIGTLGSENRLDSTVIGDAVNTTARLEQLTKKYNSSILISGETFKKLTPNRFLIRELDTLKLRGKDLPVTLYEVFDADPPEILEMKQKTQEALIEAIKTYKLGHFSEALSLFQEIVAIFPKDMVPVEYIKRCYFYQKYKPSEEFWEGITEDSLYQMHRAHHRAAPRVDFNSSTEIRSKGKLEGVNAATVDMSRSGLQLQLNQQSFEIGDLILIELENNPEDAESSEEPLQLLSQVTWRKESKGVWRMGAEFVMLTSEQEQALHHALVSASLDKESLENQ